MDNNAIRHNEIKIGYIYNNIGLFLGSFDQMLLEQTNKIFHIRNLLSQVFILGDQIFNFWHIGD